MRQARAIWLITRVREADIRLKKAIKSHDNAITTLHIQGILGEMASIKFKRSMKLLLKDMAGLTKGLPQIK